MYCANESSSEWLPANQFDHAPRRQAFAMERLGWLVLLSIVLCMISGGCYQFFCSVSNVPECCLTLCTEVSPDTHVLSDCRTGIRRRSAAYAEGGSMGCGAGSVPG